MTQMVHTPSSSLPVVGAAVVIDDLERLHNWVLESARDLEIQDFCHAEILNGDWNILAERYKPLLDGHGGRMGIHGPFWGLDIASQDPDIRKLVTHRMNQGLDVCEALKATHMVIHSPYTTWDHNNLDNNAGAREAVVARAHQTLGEIVKRAGDLGVLLVIENIEDIDPNIRVDLARSFASEAVRVSLDTGHAHYAHGSNGAPPVDYFVKVAGKMLAHVHLQDADGYADRHWAPGEGSIRWHAVFDAIRRYSDSPRLILELNDGGKILQAADHLASLGLVR
ncbi:MAG: sugar phosphate isomerase/epimerase [Nitratireductor sp.]